MKREKMMGVLLHTVRDKSKSVVGENSKNSGGRAMGVAGDAALKHRQRRKLEFNLFKAIVFYSYFLLFNACHVRLGNQDRCSKQYKNARIEFNSYLMEENTSQVTDTSQLALMNILAQVDSSMQCPNTRMASIELKISILLKLQKYHEGYVFIDSLKGTDFRLKYKKQMWGDYFRAMDYESKDDTINRNRYFLSIVTNIQDYIQKENLPNDKIDEESYYDLFYIQSKILGKDELKTKIEQAKQQYPNSKDFFEALQTMLVNSDTATSDVHDYGNGTGTSEAH